MSLKKSERRGVDDDGVRPSTRSLRSTKNDEGEQRKRASRRGAQSPASMLLEKGLPDAVMEDDFTKIEKKNIANAKRMRLATSSNG